jgi:hypothetical protein
MLHLLRIKIFVTDNYDYIIIITFLKNTVKDSRNSRLTIREIIPKKIQRSSKKNISSV